MIRVQLQDAEQNVIANMDLSETDVIAFAQTGINTLLKPGYVLKLERLS